MAKASPLDGYDYMLLRIEVRDSRDDFLTFEAFSTLLREAIHEGLRDRASGDAVIKTAAIAAWSSPDLTAVDRLRVAKALLEYYEKVVGPAGHTPPPDAGGLRHALNKQILAIDPSHLASTAADLAARSSLDREKFLKSII